MVFAITAALCAGSVIGTIVTKIVMKRKCIGTLHIEPDMDDGGEKYRFSFNDFSAARNSKLVTLRMVDHTR